MNKSTVKPKLWGSCRMNVALCVFLAAVQTSMLRDNLGIALVCMSKPIKNLSCDINDAIVPVLPWLTNKQNCQFDWDSSTRGRALGAFLYGYITTTVIGGYLSSGHGAKIPLVYGGVGNAVFHLLCPTAALMHAEWFFACRFLQGTFAGLMAGPFFQLFGAWFPEDETSVLLAISFSGFSFGTILIYPMSGQLCSSNVSGIGGWPLIFYVPAIVSVLFIVVWIRCLYDVPEKHPNISQEEYDYLLENIGISEEPAVIPWLSIFTSMPFIAYIICYSVFLWNIFTMLNNMPLFLQTMLGIKSKESGYLYCIPFISTFIVRIFIGRTYPIVKNYLGLSNTICRKSYVVFGNVILIISLLSLVLVSNITKWHAIAAITTNLAFGDFAYSGGFYPTLLDMAPNYAGLLSGISTFVAFLASCPSTYVNSIIIKQNTKEEWNMVLWIIIVEFIFSMSFYLIYGSTSLQKWSLAQLNISDRVTSRSTLLLRQSCAASRSISMRRPTHMF